MQGIEKYMKKFNPTPTIPTKKHLYNAEKLTVVLLLKTITTKKFTQEVKKSNGVEMYIRGFIEGWDRGFGTESGNRMFKMVNKIISEEEKLIKKLK